MRNNIITVCLFCIIMNFGCVQPVMSAPPEPDIGKEWQLTFEDNFDGPAGSDPNPAFWTEYPYQNRRSGFWSPEEVFLDGSGNLVIQTRQLSTGEHVSGAVHTKDKFEQIGGYWEFGFSKLASVEGHWGGVWLMQDPTWFLPSCDPYTMPTDCGVEIDIIELPYAKYGWGYTHNLHWGGYLYASDTDHSAGSYVDKPIADGYHIFGLLWEEDRYTFFIYNDDTGESDPYVWTVADEDYSASGANRIPISKVPEYIILSDEIDWESATWAGDIRSVLVSDLPDSYKIDYVRVYAQVDSDNIPSPTDSPVYNVADINTDGVVDLRDYSILVSNFFRTNPDPHRADINDDGIVDLRDYSILVANFFLQS